MKKCLKVPKFALEKAAQQNIGRPHWQGLISKAWKAWKHSSSLTNTLTPGDLYHLNVPIYGGGRSDFEESLPQEKSCHLPEVMGIPLTSMYQGQKEI